MKYDSSHSTSSVSFQEYIDLEVYKIHKDISKAELSKYLDELLADIDNNSKSYLTKM